MDRLLESLPRFEDLVALLPGAFLGVVCLALAAWIGRRGMNDEVPVALQVLRAPVQALPQRLFAAIFGALAFAAAVWTTWWMTRGHDLPPWPPSTSSERGVWALAAVAIVAVIGEVFGHVRLLRTLRIAALGVVVWVVLQPLIARGAAEGGVATTDVLGAFAILAVFDIVLLLVACVPGPALALAACVGLGASGQLLAIAGSASLGQMLGTCSMVCGAASLLALVSRQPIAPAACYGLVGVLAAVFVDARWFLDTPPPASSFLLLLAVPLTPLLLWTALGRAKTALGLALVLALAMLLAGGALALGLADIPPPVEDPYAEFK